MAQQTPQEPDSIILKPNQQAHRNHHYHPPLLPLKITQHRPHILARQAPLACNRLPNIPRTRGIQALPNTKQLHSRRNNHNAQQGRRKPLQQTDQRLTKEHPDHELKHTKEDDAGAGTRPEAVLRRQAAGAVAHGHGAEPAAEKIHSGDAEGDGGDVEV